jgi:hypothetical protein
MIDAENTDLSELDALKSAGDEALSHRAAEAREKTFADALADHLVERGRLEQELAASRAATKKAERESRSLRREILASETARSNARTKEIFTETADDLRARAARQRASVPSFDEILATLRGSPDAQALARMVVDAARRARDDS